MGSKTSPDLLSVSEPSGIPFTLASVLPNVSQALDGTGFIFGAGSSFEAGYPMIPTLTREVLAALNTTEKTTLEEVLIAASAAYDNATATPNIETLADLVIAHHINTNLPRFKDLENKFRKLILDIILSVDSPNLSNHVHFFERLKARAYGQPCTVWLFTTNYDLLFETAASIAGVQLENGFTGTTERYFTPEMFQRVCGTVGNGIFRIGKPSFTPDSQLTVKLIKIHGSVSWFKQGDRIYERHPKAIPLDAERIMVMPRRRKVIDTLVFPYDSLFAISTRVIGNQCKYLASCGFSFSDDHINQNIFSPIMKAAKCQLSVLSEYEPTTIPDIISLPNFNGGYSPHLRIKGQHAAGATDLWKFSNFVQLF
jgi:hypothetical protein